MAYLFNGGARFGEVLIDNIGRLDLRTILFFGVVG
jgi:hypothetical protein